MMIKTVLKILAAAAGAVLLAAAGYAAYLFLSYSRIPDEQELEVITGTEEAAVPGREYTAVSYNIGFGAYTADFTFFMDDGKESRARSKESVVECVNGTGEAALSFGPDLVLYQEVDTDSTRSHHVDETELLRGLHREQGKWDSVFAQNYHSAYLMYPFTEPHGASNSGILTMSRLHITDALRRSLPIAEDLKKFLDLDRCYSISRIPVENGRELVVFNVHLSAYGTDASQGNAQLEMLFGDLEAEYAKGNYVLCGGDFNHDFTGDSVEYFNPGTDQDYSWSQPFPADLLPAGFSRCIDYAGEKISTSRRADIPYSEDSFIVILDGFIVSDNIVCREVRNEDFRYQYTDHNPVVMTFVLQPAD